VGIREQIDEYANISEEELIVFDGLDDAILGIAHTHTQPTRVVYSYEKIITILINEGQSYEEALDYYGHNIECLWAGEGTPSIMHVPEGL